MIAISLQDAAKMARGLLLAGEPALMLSSVHFDTRQLAPESLFVAVRGETRDGHDYLAQAASAGARAALISDPDKVPRDLPAGFGLVLVNDTVRAFQHLALAYRKRLHIPFVAVTGSNGKTTTKDIIAHVLSERLNVFKTYKNFNNHLGVPFSLLAIKGEHEAAVLELGMNRAGEIDTLASLVQPDVSVITTIGDAHIEFFGTREKIALAKAELLPHTAADGVALLNGDNPYLRQVGHLFDGEILYYSTQGPADIWAEGIETDERGTSFTIRFRDGEAIPVVMPLYGRHNVSNALPAAATARRLGLSAEEIAAALATVAVSPMRFEVSRLPSGVLVINDAYNASPSSMKASIDTFLEVFPGRRKVAVLGDMFELGAESPQLHAEVGDYLNGYRNRLELLVTVGTDALHLYDAYQGAKYHAASKEAAAELLRERLTPDHAVLFKASRGMKLETVIESVVATWNG